MKNLWITLLLLPAILVAQTPCPRWGSAKPGTLIYTLNVKKNRLDTAAVYKEISIQDFLKLNDDSTFDGEAYKLTGGYVIKVKRQGPESCNCKSKTNRDFHIVVVPDPKDASDVSKYVIVEITPGFQKMFGWTDDTIKNLKNHHVDFFGWKFADLEHINMSLKSRPTQKRCWRGTVNEIHPITKFIVHN